MSESLPVTCTSSQLQAKGVKPFVANLFFHIVRLSQKGDGVSGGGDCSDDDEDDGVTAAWEKGGARINFQNEEKLWECLSKYGLSSSPVGKALEGFRRKLTDYGFQTRKIEESSIADGGIAISHDLFRKEATVGDLKRIKPKPKKKGEVQTTTATSASTSKGTQTEKIKTKANPVVKESAQDEPPNLNDVVSIMANDIKLIKLMLQSILMENQVAKSMAGISTGSLTVTSNLSTTHYPTNTTLPVRSGHDQDYQSPCCGDKNDDADDDDDDDDSFGNTDERKPKRKRNHLKNSNGNRGKHDGGEPSSEGGSFSSRLSNTGENVSFSLTKNKGDNQEVDKTKRSTNNARDCYGFGNELSSQSVVRVGAPDTHDMTDRYPLQNISSSNGAVLAWDDIGVRINHEEPPNALLPSEIFNDRLCSDSVKLERKDPTLSELDYECNSLTREQIELLMESLQYNPHVKNIRIVQNDLRFVPPQPIASALSSLPKLAKLDFSGNDLDSYFVSKIFSGPLPPSIRSINLSRNLITSMGITKIKKDIISLRHLEELYLDENSIGDQGAFVLSSFIPQMCNLKKLSLCGCRIGETGALFLGSAWMKNERLSEVCLDENCTSESTTKQIDAMTRSKSGRMQVLPLLMMVHLVNKIHF